MIPTGVLTVVARITGPMISVGLAEPEAARMAITAAGINWTLLVLITRKVHMASVAVPFFSLRRFSSSMAFSPRGVAALPSPSILAEMFMIMAPMAGCSGGTSGKSRIITGFRERASVETSPDCSAIFIRPSQRAMMPIRPMASSTAIRA